MKFIQQVETGAALAWQAISMPVRSVYLSGGVLLLLAPWFLIFASSVRPAILLRMAAIGTWKAALVSNQWIWWPLTLALMFLVFVPATRQVFNALAGHPFSWRAWAQSFSLSWRLVGRLLLVWVLLMLFFIVLIVVMLLLTGIFLFMPPLWLPLIFFFLFVGWFYMAVATCAFVMLVRFNTHAWQTIKNAGRVLWHNFAAYVVYMFFIALFLCALGGIAFGGSWLWQSFAVGFPLAEIFTTLIVLYATIVLLIKGPLFVHRFWMPADANNRY